MFNTEDTNQIENEDFMDGFKETDDSESEELTEETTAKDAEEEEDTNEAETAEEGKKTEQDQQQEQTVEVEMFPRVIKFLGEERQISMDEAVTAIQKGLNYDEVVGRYKKQVEGFAQDPRVLFVENLAKAAGVSAGEYITMQENQGEYQALIDEYGDISAVPPAIMEKYNKYSEGNIAKARADAQVAAAQAYREEKEAEYLNFVENHPDFSGEIPQEVVESVSKGESLEGAYAIYQLKAVTAELAQVKKEFEIYKTNTANKNSRIPDAKSSRKKDNDDFMRGFMDVF